MDDKGYISTNDYYYNNNKIILLTYKNIIKYKIKKKQ